MSCASSSKDIAAIYVPPTQYGQFGCDQLSQEFDRLEIKKNSLATNLDKKASNDQGITAVSLILFWPAAFALGGNEVQEAEYAQLKGEYDAVQMASIGKNCNLETTGVKLTKGLSKLNTNTGYYGYAQAEEEVVSGTYDKNLWAKALVDANGDESQRKINYIQLRAHQLQNEQTINPNQVADIDTDVGKGVDVSGTYISQITSDNQWAFKRRFRKKIITLRDEGKNIKVTRSSLDVEINVTRKDGILYFSTTN